MPSSHRSGHLRHRPFRALLAGLVCAAMASTSLLASAAGASTTPAKKASGNVNVLYAASLQTIMETVIGPRFEKATGYTFTGFSGASGTLATEIKGGVVAGDVFISANAATNITLQGAANGNKESWYDVFASSPLVIGYNPNSLFAEQLKTEPWYKVITQPGFRLGRTDPTTDPKGKLAVQAVAAAAQIYNDPSLTSVTATTANVYPEQTLVGLLQSGQLDAGFFYSSEAKAAKIPTVSLRKLFLAATYTVSILNGAPDAQAAQAFVAFLLGNDGQKLLKREGATNVRHRLIGSESNVPRMLRGLVTS